MRDGVDSNSMHTTVGHQFEINVKEIYVLEGGAAVGAAIALTSAGPLGAIAAAIPALVNVGFDAIKTADQKRAKKLFERMLVADEDAAQFADALNSRLSSDPEVVAAFRALMVASVEAVALAAIEPIALVGRQHLRGTCPAWVARSWLRILTDLAEPELRSLRGLIHDAVRRRARVVAYNENPANKALQAPAHVKLRLYRDWHSHSQLYVSFNFVPDFIFKGLPPSAFAHEFSDRLWQLLSQNHLGVILPDYEQLKREREAEENRAQRRGQAQQSGGSVRYSMFDEPREHTELLRFHEQVFDVIAQAFPLPSEESAGTIAQP